MKQNILTINIDSIVATKVFYKRPYPPFVYEIKKKGDYFKIFGIKLYSYKETTYNFRFSDKKCTKEELPYKIGNQFYVDEENDKIFYKPHIAIWLANTDSIWTQAIHVYYDTLEEALEYETKLWHCKEKYIKIVNPRYD